MTQSITEGIGGETRSRYAGGLCFYAPVVQRFNSESGTLHNEEICWKSIAGGSCFYAPFVQ